MVISHYIFPGVVLLAVATPLQAQSSQQATTYTHDALGRLVKVKVTGGQADNTQRDYTYDATGNRTHVSASGASNDGGGAGGDGGSQTPGVATLRVSFNGRFIVQRKR